MGGIYKLITKIYYEKEIIFYSNRAKHCAIRFLQKTELYYSCNREIDHWVRENINNISKITREDFLAYRNDVDRQKAIYAALSPEQKTHLWKAKIEDVLSLSWSEKERMHIASLLTIIDIISFFL